MKGKPRWRWSWVVWIGCWALAGGTARLSEGQWDWKPGDILITRTEAPLMDEDRVMTTVSEATRLVAGEIRGNWVLVAVKKDSFPNTDGKCPVCGQRDWTRPVWFSSEIGIPRPSSWIRGWVNVRYLYRESDCGESRITFENQSDHGATVRLIGPMRREVYVPRESTRTIPQVRAGHYYILVRYDDGRVVAGEHFDVKATATTYSKITITLHGVVGGNYPTRSVPENIFRSWGTE